MLGAIIGDVIGSVHEWAGTKTKNFPLFTECSTFTDDSVLTIAVADWILTGQDLVDLLHDYTDAYPGRGYGGMYHHWAARHLREPYNSFGNGAAMRVSPVGFAFATMQEVLDWAKRSAEVTHNHPEGIRGAQATAAAIYLARRFRDKDQIRHTVESEFGYDLSTHLDEIRRTYHSTRPARGPFPKRSQRSWNPPATKTPYAMPSHSVATPTRSPVSPVASQKRTTVPPPKPWQGQ